MNTATIMSADRHKRKDGTINGKGHGETRRPIGSSLDAWLTGREARGEIAASTVATYAGHIKGFIRHIGADTDLADITLEDLEGWVASLRRPDGKPMQASARNTKVSTIRSFFAFATERGWLEVNPFIWINPAKVPRRVAKRIPPAELTKILATAPFRERTMILLMLQVGLRRGEIAGLALEDYDPHGRWLTVIGKGDRERRCAVPEEAAVALEKWVDAMPGDVRTGPMWPSSHNPGQGISPRTVSARITQVSNDCGLHVHPHRYRHTMATEAVQAGATLPALAQQLGHSSAKVTADVYLSANDEEIAEQMEGRTYLQGRDVERPAPDPPAAVAGEEGGAHGT